MDQTPANPASDRNISTSRAWTNIMRNHQTSKESGAGCTETSNIRDLAHQDITLEGEATSQRRRRRVRTKDWL